MNKLVIADETLMFKMCLNYEDDDDDDHDDHDDDLISLG